jgi:malate dehydrogenase
LTCSNLGVQFGGDEVVKAKDGAGSATLSMAYAGFRFAENVIKAVKGESGIIAPTYVYLPGVDGGDEIAKLTGVDFFSVPVELGVSYVLCHACQNEELRS